MLEKITELESSIEEITPKLNYKFPNIIYPPFFRKIANVLRHMIQTIETKLAEIDQRIIEMKADVESRFFGFGNMMSNNQTESENKTNALRTDITRIDSRLQELQIQIEELESRLPNQNRS